MLPNTGVQTGESIHLIRFRFALVYVGSIGIFFVPFDWSLALLAFLSFAIRTIGWEAGGHRYFAHRSFRTSRVFQCVLAILTASAGQRGPIWWAVQHRHHHRFSDTDRDAHSPVTKGLYVAYAGWFLSGQHSDTDLDGAKEFSRYPELVWINRYHYIFPYVVLACCYLVGEGLRTLDYRMTGLSAAIWGFFFATFLSYQGALLLNAFAHGSKPGLFSYRTFNTGDHSKNNWVLCLLSMGANWHNNHHRYMSSARAGFYWWELDITYWTLKVLQKLGVVWAVRTVPEALLQEGREQRLRSHVASSGS